MELLRDDTVKIISHFLVGYKRSWLIYTKQEDDFKTSTTLKKYFNVLFFLIFLKKAFMKQGYLA